MNRSRKRLELGWIYITLMGIRSGETHTTHRSFDASSLGAMNASAEFTEQITCPVCRGSLVLSVGALERSPISNSPGSAPTQAFPIGIDDWNITYKSSEGWRIDSATESYTLTAPPMPFLKQLPGFHNQQWLLCALEALLEYTKTYPGATFSSKYMTRWCFSSRTTESLRKLLRLLGSISTYQSPIPTPSSSLGG